MEASELKHDATRDVQRPPEESQASPTISASMSDEEKQQHEADTSPGKVSAFNGLGELDQYLAV